MARSSILAAIALLGPPLSPATGEPDALQLFAWRIGTNTIGRLTVPPGFKVSAYNYREGVVTTLSYPDGASIVLQAGGLYRNPMFQDPVHRLARTLETGAKTVRSGEFGYSRRWWRCDSYKVADPAVQPASILRLIPPQIGYLRVRSKHRHLFDRALDSFERRTIE